MENRMNDPRFKSYSRKAHPLADLFPMLDEQALKELAEDIKTNGQHQPIILCGELVVDGRNRLKACEMAGVMPDSLEKQFKDDAEIAKYIVSQNIHRRHLSTSQRAAIAAEMATLQHGSNRFEKKIDVEKSTSIPTRQAAELLNVSRDQVQKAKSVKKSSPELFEKVKSGEMSVAAAERQLKPKAIDSDDGIIQEEDVDDSPVKILRYWLPVYVDVEGDGGIDKAKAFFERLLKIGGIRVSDSNNDELQRFLNQKKEA